MLKMCNESHYCLHSAIELLDLPIDIYMYLDFKNIDLDLLIENNRDWVSVLNTNYNYWFNNEATNIEKSSLCYYYIFHSASLLNDMINGLFGKIERYYLYNKKKEEFWKLDKNKQSEWVQEKFISTKYNVLTSKNNLKEFLKDDLIKLKKYFEHFSVLSNNVFNNLQEVMEYNYNIKYKNDNSNNLFNKDFNREIFEDIFNEKIKYKQKEYLLKKEDNKIRNIFNKSLKILNKYIGEKNTKCFINSSDGFQIEGKLFNYRLKNKGDLLLKTKQMDNTHIPFALELYNKENKYLTELCITFPGSPVLDQVLSVYLMIISDNEKLLIQNSNLIGVKSNDCYNNEKLIELNKINVKKDDFFVEEFRGLLSLKGIGENIKNDNNKDIIYKKTIIEKNKGKLNKKINNLIFLLFSDSLMNDFSLNEKKLLLKELFNQELSWDEKIDYIGVNIPMPEHLDFLNKTNN